MVNTLADCTGWDAELNYGRLAQVAKKLLTTGYTAQQVAVTYGKSNGRITAWYEKDWRGKKNQMPEPEDILHTISNLAKSEMAETEYVHIERGPIDNKDSEPTKKVELPEHERLWQTVMCILEPRLTKRIIDMYFMPCKPLSFDNFELVLEAGDIGRCEWLECNASRIVERLLIGICNKDIEVRFVDVYHPETMPTSPTPSG